MPVVTYRVTGPEYMWEIRMASLKVSLLSREQVRFPVYADSDGAPVDVSGYTVEAAFMGGDGYESGENPQAGDWKGAVWMLTATGNWVAAAEVGPGSASVLDAGSYSCWLRITEVPAGAVVVRQVGTLIVE
jgi:hypothetical protein